MTRVVVTKTKGNITKVECNGHTGYGACGEDIVCAGLSSIVQTALLGLLKVVKIDVISRINGDKGYIYIELPIDLTEQEQYGAQIVLNTMFLGVNDLYQGYSDFIELEVK